MSFTAGPDAVPTLPMMTSSDDVPPSLRSMSLRLSATLCDL